MDSFFCWSSSDSAAFGSFRRSSTSFSRRCTFAFSAACWVRMFDNVFWRAVLRSLSAVDSFRRISFSELLFFRRAFASASDSLSLRTSELEAWSILIFSS